MANFEALIRGALTSQDASDAQIRAKIYQSSRNALHRMITENRSFTVEAAIAQQQDLEDAISRIEGEFNLVTPEPIVEESIYAEPSPAVVEEQPAFTPEPAVEPEQLPPETQAFTQAPEEPAPAFEQPQKISEEPVQADDPLAELQAILGDDVASPQVSNEVITPEPAPEYHNEPYVEQHMPAADPVMEAEADTYPQSDPLEDYYTEERKPPLGFAKRRKSQKRFMGLVIFLLIILFVAYLAYAVFSSFRESGFIGGSSNQNQNILSRQNNREDFITVLEASDTSSLIVANRGSAEIITQQNSQMIRLSSMRSEQDREQSAEPILLRLPPGVVEQISNKSITVEIFAKSGTSSPAQYRVSCQFEGFGECTPKRFRIGLQPEASVFGATIGNVVDPDQAMYFAINTDTTNTATVTGKGDVIDIAYVRIKVN